MLRLCLSFVLVSHQQIDAACSGFPDSAVVGRGGFGPVFRGRFLGEEVAVKRLDSYGLQGLPNFLREVQVKLSFRIFQRKGEGVRGGLLLYHCCGQAVKFIVLAYDSGVLSPKKGGSYCTLSHVCRLRRYDSSLYSHIPVLVVRCGHLPAREHPLLCPSFSV